MIESSPDLVSVHVTVPDPELAEQLARALVERRLAACVNVLPGVRSVYRWNGAVEQGDELLLLIKTERARLPELEAEVLARHSDEVPCLLVQSVEAGHAPYVAWLHEQVSPAPR